MMHFRKKEQVKNPSLALFTIYLHLLLVNKIPVLLNSPSCIPSKHPAFCFAKIGDPAGRDVSSPQDGEGD